MMFSATGLLESIRGTTSSIYYGLLAEGATDGWQIDHDKQTVWKEHL